MTGVRWSRRHRAYVYDPEPMTADDCEAIALALDCRDSWGDDLRAAAAEIRRLTADDDVTPWPALGIVVVDRGAR